MLVVVIGAGVAGLTAARDLSRSKIPVVLLEAQARIGGRVFTTKEGYDLGASWIHDSENNELFPVVKSLGLPYTFDQKLFYYNRGEHVPAGIIEEAGRLLSSAGEASIHESLREWVIDKTQGIKDFKQRSLVQKATQSMEHWSGQSWYDMVALGGVPHFSSPDAFNLAGNSSLINWLTSEIDWEYVQLRTNTPVKEITQSGHYNVELESGETIATDYIICTMPVGAMRELNPFKLQLPPQLQRAIEKSTMATLGKVALEFDERWWDDVPDRMEVFADVDPENYTLGETALAPGEQPVFFTNAYKSTGKPTLIALISGPLTVYLEAHPEKSLEMLMPALQQIRRPAEVPKPVPEPKKIIVTDWTTNRFFRGSYSEVTIGEDPIETLSAFETGAGNLRFAGEHTIEHGAGCMHGAYGSGQREASWVLGKIKSSA